MAKFSIPDKYLILVLFVILTILLVNVVLLVFVSVQFLKTLQVTNPTSSPSSNDNADILVNIVTTQKILANLTVNVFGNGVNVTVPISTYCYVGCVQSVSDVSNSSTSQYPLPYPITQYNLIFTRFKPYSTYNVTVSGLAMPYCPPNLVCTQQADPNYLISIHESQLVETGANNYTIRVTFQI